MLIPANPITYFHLTQPRARVRRQATPTTTRLTTAQLCEELQCSRQSIMRWIKAGQLTAQRVGRDLRFHRTAIEAFLARQSRPKQRRRQRHI